MLNIEIRIIRIDIDFALASVLKWVELIDSLIGCVYREEHKLELE